MSVQHQILVFLEGKDYTKTLDIARAVYGPTATRRSINKYVYELQKLGKIEKISKDNGGDPKWKLKKPSSSSRNEPPRVETSRIEPHRVEVGSASDDRMESLSPVYHPPQKTTSEKCMDCGSKTSKKVKCKTCKRFCCEEWYKVTFITEDDFEEDDDTTLTLPLCLDCYRTSSEYFPQYAERKQVQRNMHMGKF